MPLKAIGAPEPIKVAAPPILDAYATPSNIGVLIFRLLSFT